MLGGYDDWLRQRDPLPQSTSNCLPLMFEQKLRPRRLSCPTKINESLLNYRKKLNH